MNSTQTTAAKTTETKWAVKCLSTTGVWGIADTRLSLHDAADLVRAIRAGGQRAYMVRCQ